MCGHSDTRSGTRRAVELEREDAWAWHAVTHCLEMQGRRAEGIAWLRSDTDA